jgi:uncharacterized protein
VETEERPFWKTKALEEMSAEEWESLCDRCARCCLLKIEDEDTGDIHLTRLACSLLDVKSCRCSDYPNRFKKMFDCLSVDPAAVRQLTWLPATCGYRLVHEGHDLKWWHPLISGSHDTVHAAGISVRGWARSETGVKPSAIHRYIIEDFTDD